MPPPVRIAMWSGPRNISTAMLRSFGARPDTFVTDEPLYAHYLRHTSADHPGRDHVIAAHDPDWRRVAAVLTGPIPRGQRIWYQKHMAHHLTGLHPSRDWDWMLSLTNAFLIRDPAEMITSYIKVMPNPTPADLGLPQQVALFNWIRGHTGRTPAVIDSRDVLENPRRILTALCGRLGVEFDDRMLAWRPGPRETDGVWGPWWYDAVYRSSTFGAYAPKGEAVPSRLKGVLEECSGMYQNLAVAKVESR